MLKPYPVPQNYCRLAGQRKITKNVDYRLPLGFECNMSHRLDPRSLRLRLLLKSWKGVAVAVCLGQFQLTELLLDLNNY
jgi:hypothetical protein